MNHLNKFGLRFTVVALRFAEAFNRLAEAEQVCRKP
jgi:hypothetical protein